jgi:hypothetical protein
MHWLSIISLLLYLFSINIADPPRFNESPTEWIFLNWHALIYAVIGDDPAASIRIAFPPLLSISILSNTQLYAIS